MGKRDPTAGVETIMTVIIYSETMSACGKTPVADGLTYVAVRRTH